MITFTSERVRGHNDVCPTVTNSRTQRDAFNQLVQYELGYNGDVIEISETKVVTRTQIMSCVDTTTFEGSAEEMRPLYEVAALSVLSRKEYMEGRGLQNVCANLTDPKGILGPKAGVPLYLKLVFPLASGTVRARSILVALLTEKAQEHRDKLMSMSLKDVVAVYEMVVFENASLEDVLELV